MTSNKPPWVSKTLSEHLLRMGFVKTKFETSLFVWKHLDVTIYVFVYVDDIIITGNYTLVIKFVIRFFVEIFSL